MASWSIRKITTVRTEWIIPANEDTGACYPDFLEAFQAARKFLIDSGALEVHPLSRWDIKVRPGEDEVALFVERTTYERDDDSRETP